MVDKRSDRRIILYCLASLRSERGRLCLEWLATFSWTGSRHPWKMHIFISKVYMITRWHQWVTMEAPTSSKDPRCKQRGF
jgi:hypothetical protein